MEVSYHPHMTTCIVKVNIDFDLENCVNMDFVIEIREKK